MADKKTLGQTIGYPGSGQDENAGEGFWGSVARKIKGLGGSMSKPAAASSPTNDSSPNLDPEKVRQFQKAFK